MTPSGPIRIKSGETLHDVCAVGDGGATVLVDPGATGWTIDGFDLEAPRPTDGREPWRAVSIYVQGGSGTIRNGRFRDTAAAVYAEGMEGRLVVEGVHISGVRWDRPRAVGIQLNGCTGGAIIDGCVSDAYLPGGIEDAYTFFNCHGTSEKRFVVRNCWGRGGIGNGPTQADGNFTGCGINFGDGGGSWFDAIGNVFVMPANTAIGVHGSNVRILDNLIWGWGEQDTMTGAAVAIHEGASEVYSAGNRALVRSWQWGGKGELGAGYWTHPSVTSAIETGNTWQDQTLTAEIWTPPEIYCMTTTTDDEKAIAAREALLAPWRVATFMEDVLDQAKSLSTAIQGVFAAQLLAAQSVAKDAEQMRQAAERAPAAQKASDIARDAVALFADRYTVSTKGDAAAKGMAECVELAKVARKLAEAP
jgi:hypothetical protein